VLPNPQRFEDWRKWLLGAVSQSVVLWDEVKVRVTAWAKRHGGFSLVPWMRQMIR